MMSAQNWTLSVYVVLAAEVFLGISEKWEPSSLSESHNGWFALNSWRDPFDVQPMQPLDTRPLQSTGI